MHKGRALLPHEQQVIDERNELESKIANLAKFFETDACKYILQRERDALRLQFSVMQTYSEILRIRIRNFGLPDKA